MRSLFYGLPSEDTTILTTTTQWSLLVKCAYETGVVWALDKQCVRLYCWVCVLGFASVIGVPCSMRSSFHPRAPFCFPNTLTGTVLLIMGLHWSSLVECMERVPCWPWMNSTYVCIDCCVCSWIELCCWCSMQCEVVMSPSSYPVQTIRYNQWR